MGYFKIRRALAVSGGSVVIGADTNLYRSSANVLKTDDALTVAGTLTAAAAITAQSSFTQSGGSVSISGTITDALNITGGLLQAGSANFSGTPFKVPYATATPNINVNGQLQTLQKGNRSYMLYYLGGTPCYITLPQETGGTMLVTVGGTP